MIKNHILDTISNCRFEPKYAIVIFKKQQNEYKNAYFSKVG